MKHRIAAFHEFVQRYWQVFKAAWSIRNTLDPPKRSEDERAFLPAHLELTETPVSPASRWIMRGIIAFFCIALLWSIIGTMDIVAVAPGRTLVSSRTKVIQPAEISVVKRILVRDGQAVERNQLLIALDAAGTDADYTKAEDALINARLAEARLIALEAALNTGQPPQLAEHADLPQARLAAEQHLAASQFSAYRSRHQELMATLAQRKAELNTLNAMIAPLQEIASISKSRAEDYATLVEGQYVGRHDYLLREQERISAERDLATQRNRLQEIGSALNKAREELNALTAQTRQQTLDGLRQAREQIQQYAPEVIKAEQRTQRMLLHSPVAGTVQQLAVHTVGGVVTPAQPLMMIVPEGDALEVEATVLNKDIGFIRPGQQVSIKVDSFPYTRYGYLEGTIESVSHDAVQDEKLGLVFYVRVKLKQSFLMVNGTRITMSPGMSLTVEIKTGRRRIIEYLLSAFEQKQSESMRER